MIDFPIQENPTLVQCLLVFVYYLFIVGKSYKRNIVFYSSDNFTLKQTNRFFVLFALGVIFYMIAGDFWHYQELVIWKHFLDAPQWNHIEETYTPIIAFVDRNYLLFRMIVWGGASLLTYICLRLFCKQPYHALFILFSCNLSGFAYGRVTLALSIYFLGIAILLTDKIRMRLIKYAVGIILIGCSYFFHHSVLMLIAITPILFVPLNKFTIFLTLACIPILVYLLGFVLGEMATNEVLEEEGVAERIVDLSASGGYSGFKLFQRYYSYLTILVSAFVFVYQQIKRPSGVLAVEYKAMCKIMCGIILVAFCTLIVMPTDLFFYRFLGMTIIPFTVLMTYLHDDGLISNNAFKFLWTFNMFSLLSTILYKIYAVFITG